MIFAILALAIAQVDLSFDCNNEDTTLEMPECARIDYQRTDADLNQQWQLALVAAQQFDRENADSIRRGQMRSLQNALRTAQRAWIVYRDTHCDAEARNYNSASSTHHLILNICLRKLTEMRTQQLSGFSEGQAS